MTVFLLSYLRAAAKVINIKETLLNKSYVIWFFLTDFKRSFRTEMDDFSSSENLEFVPKTMHSNI